MKRLTNGLKRYSQCAVECKRVDKQQKWHCAKSECIGHSCHSNAKKQKGQLKNESGKNINALLKTKV